MKNRIKKILIFVLCEIILFSLTGCNSLNNKQVLKLNHIVNLSELEPSELLYEKQDNIKIENLPEVERKMYDNELYLDFITDYIKNNLNVDIDNRWEFVIHYYNDEKTDGMIQFTYMIDNEIRTNKNITFGYENGYINYIYYKCLDMKIDEENLIQRVKKFKNNHIQEKIKLKKDEKFESETTTYSYYYNVDKLVYSYAVFFSYDGGIINNDNATAYFIDKDGRAIK